MMSGPDILAVQHAEAILQWYLENGVDEPVSSTPVDRLAPKILSASLPEVSAGPPSQPVPFVMSGMAESKAEAIRLASAATTLDELKTAIGAFEGLALKKTAMNMVFASGNPAARIMVIGDAPEADDDRAGQPFSGLMGQLADKMFSAIGLSRGAEDISKSIYLTNILNWRPPGNRTPLAAEIELSLPFIYRHIELVKPQVLFLMGALSSKALLGTDDAIGKLRGKLHTAKIGNVEYPAVVTYNPTFLLRNPLKKREAWEDLQKLKGMIS